jgi:imidazolonepropionase
MASPRLIYNIKQLVNVRQETRLLRGRELAELPCIDDAWVLIEGGRIAGYGAMAEVPRGAMNDEAIDASGRLVLPAWCDSHTHLVFAGSREGEFVDKVRGLSYAEIAARAF